jgi:hypothetical protein
LFNNEEETHELIGPLHELLQVNFSVKEDAPRKIPSCSSETKDPFQNEIN